MLSVDRVTEQIICKKEVSVDEHIRSLLNHNSTEMTDCDGVFIISSDTVIKLKQIYSKQKGWSFTGHTIKLFFLLSVEDISILFVFKKQLVKTVEESTQDY